MKRFGKYNARPTWAGGRRYASRAEAEYGAVLKLLEKNNEIFDLRMQPVIELTRYVSYRPDFTYFDKNGRLIYVDVKGVETPEFKLKMNLWREFGPPAGELRIVKKIGRRFVTVKMVERERGQENNG